MKLGCICGTFNRSFDSGAMDQIRFLRRLRRRPQRPGRGAPGHPLPPDPPRLPGNASADGAEPNLSIVAVGAHNDFGRIDPTLRQSEVTKVKQWVEVAEQLGAPLVRVFAGYPDRATARSAGLP